MSRCRFERKSISLISVSLSISEVNSFPMLTKKSFKESAVKLSSEIVISSIFSCGILLDFLFLPRRLLISLQLCPMSLDCAQSLILLQKIIDLTLRISELTLSRSSFIFYSVVLGVILNSSLFVKISLFHKVPNIRGRPWNRISPDSHASKRRV